MKNVKMDIYYLMESVLKIFLLIVLSIKVLQNVFPVSRVIPFSMKLRRNVKKILPLKIVLLIRVKLLVKYVIGIITFMEMNVMRLKKIIWLKIVFNMDINRNVSNVQQDTFYIWNNAFKSLHMIQIVSIIKILHIHVLSVLKDIFNKINSV